MEAARTGPVRQARRRAVPALLLAALVTFACTAAPTSTPPEPEAAAVSTAPSAATEEPTAPATPRGWEPEPFRPAAYDAWVTTVPERFPVDHRLPESASTGPGSGVTGRFCGADAFALGTAVDRVAASASGPEYGEARDLRVFADDRAAHRFLLEVAAVVGHCPEQQVGDTVWRHELRRSGAGGEEAVTAVQTFETDGLVHAGANWWEVVRVGNAVLLTSTGGEWMPGRGLDRGIRDHDRLVARIVAAMCVFSARGCPEKARHEIPAGFPLAAGWPDDEAAEPGAEFGRHGPNRRLPGPDLVACGTRLPAPAGTDRLAATWTNPEDFRARELAVFADAGEAARRVDTIAALYRACQSEELGDDYTAVHQVRPLPVGGQGWAIVRRTEWNGAPAVGLEVLLVVRFGRAVLVDTAANEGGAGQDVESDVRRQIAYQVASTATVVAAMCRFAEAGCG